MLQTFLPGLTPGHSLSTINPVNALLAGAFGSGLVRANTKYLKRVNLQKCFFKFNRLKNNLKTLEQKVDSFPQISTELNSRNWRKKFTVIDKELKKNTSCAYATVETQRITNL